MNSDPEQPTNDNPEIIPAIAGTGAVWPEPRRKVLMNCWN